MASSSNKTSRHGWVEAGGLSYLIRTLGMAVHPSKLSLALAGILLTVALGWLLDMAWIGGGVEESTVERFVIAKQMGESFEETTGEMGLFQAWRNYERRCLLAFLGAAIPPRASLSVAWENLCNMFRGVWWLASAHSFYFILFAAGSLLIWSYFGGAICRIAAVQFAHDEKPSAREALAFARGKFFGGFYLAPCIPLAFIVITMVCLALGGMLLRVPILGDILGGLGFIIALVGGFVITLIMIGMIVGGSLFWPAVAAEGSDAFDAFSRGLAYPLSKPFKAMLYAAISVVYASFCWLFINVFVSLTLTMTRTIVGFGTSPFGWWSRGEEGASVSKLELLWPAIGPSTMVGWPDWSQLAWYECFSAFMIGIEVLLVVCLMWAFLTSFYFSGSTIIYFLLRNDVDGIDLDELYTEEYTQSEFLMDAQASATSAASEPALPEMETPIEPQNSTLDEPAVSELDAKKEETVDPDSLNKPDGTGESDKPDEPGEIQKPSSPASYTQSYKDLSSESDDEDEDDKV